MNLKFTVDCMPIVRWWVGEYFNTPECCKGRTGYMMSLVKVEVVISSRKKVNDRSST